jgi:hypothetical protein
VLVPVSYGQVDVENCTIAVFNTIPHKWEQKEMILHHVLQEIHIMSHLHNYE